METVIVENSYLAWLVTHYIMQCTGVEGLDRTITQFGVYNVARPSSFWHAGQMLDYNGISLPPAWLQDYS